MSKLGHRRVWKKRETQQERKERSKRNPTQVGVHRWLGGEESLGTNRKEWIEEQEVRRVESEVPCLRGEESAILSRGSC